MHNCGVVTSDDKSSPATKKSADVAQDAATKPVSAGPETPTTPVSPADVPRKPKRPSRGPARIKRTRVSGTWVAVIVAVVVLIFLLIFILQNPDSATVHYLGMSGTLPLGVALLFAAVGGAVIVAVSGAARILQLRRLAKRGSMRHPL